MTRLGLFLLLLSTGASANERYIDVQHDARRGVTCYILNESAISCIPDSQLQAGADRQHSPHEQEDSGPTPAAGAPRGKSERYHL